jgi:hypothetical protein
MILAQRLAQEIGQLVYMGHSLQADLDQTREDLAKAQAEVERLTKLQMAAQQVVAAA